MSLLTAAKMRAFRDAYEAYQVYGHLDVRDALFDRLQTESELATERARVAFGLPEFPVCHRFYRLVHSMPLSGEENDERRITHAGSAGGAS